MLVFVQNISLKNQPYLKSMTGSSDKIRTITCELNPLTRSDGSAMLGQGATVVIAAMVGPVEVKSQNLSIEDAYVECHFRPKVGQPSIKDKIRESLIREICEEALVTDMHPRTKMTVQLQELEDRGGLEACSINAACMALLIGGLPLKYTFAAVHCVVTKNGKLLLDPDQCQMLDSRLSFTFVYESVERKIVKLLTKGSFTTDELNNAESVCREVSQQVFNYYKDCLKRFHRRALLTESEKAKSNEKMKVMDST